MAQTFVYEARSAEGELHKGNVVAETQFDGLRDLQRKGLVVVSIAPSRELSNLVPRDQTGKYRLFKKRITLKDLAVMAREFAVLYSAGVPIVRTLRTLHGQVENRTLKDALLRVGRSVEGGQSLGESLKQQPDAFPPILYNMVAAGEVSGNLDIILSRAADHFDREFEIEEKVKGALIYPKMVAVVMLVVSVILLIWVLPEFAVLFEEFDTVLPLPTRILLGVGAFAGSYWWLMGLGAALLYGLYYLWRTTGGAGLVLDRWSLKYPVFGKLNKKKIVSRFCRSLATLLGSGVAIIPALGLVRQTIGNVIVSRDLHAAQEAIRMGQPISPQLELSGHFPPLVIQMLAIGEETGGLDTMLEKASDFIDDEIRVMTDNMTQLIEPIVIVILGVLVAGIILAVVMPMFDTFRLIQ